jgi:hypothetical protein
MKETFEELTKGDIVYHIINGAVEELTVLNVDYVEPIKDKFSINAVNERGISYSYGISGHIDGYPVHIAQAFHMTKCIFLQKCQAEEYLSKHHIHKIHYEKDI